MLSLTVALAVRWPRPWFPTATPGSAGMNRFLACLALMLMAGDALAFRCGGWLIEPGQSLYEVGEKCGDPKSAEHRIEWRVQTAFQQQCQSFPEPVYPPPVPAAPEPGKRGPQAPRHSPMIYQPRILCTSVPVSFTVPVEVDIWYFDDVSVPKALHFENGWLVWIQPLWGLRHPH
jgi:hypothetical protein